MATPTLGDLKAHAAALQSALERYKDDPRFPVEVLDALERRVLEVAEAVDRLAGLRARH